MEYLRSDKKGSVAALPARQSREPLRTKPFELVCLRNSRERVLLAWRQPYQAA